MNVPKWLQIVQTFAPMVLAFTPAAPLAPFVAAGIQAAEQLPGADGPTKLAIATQIARTGIAATNAQAGKTLIDPALSDAVIQQAIGTTIAVTNLIHAAHPDPTPA